MMPCNDVWNPPPGIVGHAGQPLNEKLNFFAPPPPEIGTLTSAFSTLKAGKDPTDPKRRQMQAAIAGAITAVIMGWICWSLGSGLLIFLTITVPLAALIAFGAYMSTAGIGECSYVGDKGVAQFKLSTKPGQRLVANVLVFQKGYELHTKQTRVYTNGGYNNTTYSFDWIGSPGPFKISGAHRAESGNPKPEDSYHFALAAEKAWTVFLLERLPEIVNKSGTVRFDFLRQSSRVPDPVYIGEGFIVLSVDGQQQRCGAADIARCTIQDGKFSVALQESSPGVFGIGRKGVLQFPYDQLGNAQLFLMLLAQVAGIRVNGR